MCRKPVGEGAKRVTTDVLALKRAFLFFNCAMQRKGAPNIGSAHLPHQVPGFWERCQEALERGRKPLPERAEQERTTGTGNRLARSATGQVTSFAKSDIRPPSQKGRQEYAAV